MPRRFAPIVPPNDPRICPPWLGKELRRISDGLKASSTGLAAVTRGETPDGSGSPLTPDLTSYFFLPGRLNGQTGYGGRAPSGNLILSSTADATKGKIYLGNPTPRVTVDETLAVVGINQTSPGSTLHIVGGGAASAAMTTTAVVIADNWGGPRGGAGGGGIAGTTGAALASNDGITSYEAVNAPTVGTNPQKNGLSGTVMPGATYIVTAMVACFSSTIDITTSAWMVSLVDSAGNQWDSAIGFNAVDSPFTAAEVAGMTPAQTFFPVTRTVVCSGTPKSTGNTPNAIWLSGSMINAVPAFLFTCVSYVTVGVATTSLLRWDTQAGVQLGQIASDGKVGINTGSVAPAASLDIAQGAALGIPAVRITTEATPTIGVYQFVIKSNAGTPLVFYDSGLGDIFQVPNMVADQSFSVNNPASPPNGHQIVSLAGNPITYNLPNLGSGGDFVITAGVQTLAAKTLGSTCILIASTASTGVSFQDTTTSSKKLRVVLSGAVGNNSFTFTNTAARNYGFGDIGGLSIIVGDQAPAVSAGRLGKVDLTAQAADIGSTNLSNTPPAGIYEVEVLLIVTASDAGAGTATVTIGWTDVLGATTDATVTKALTSTGRSKATIPMQVNSGNITYTVTGGGTYGTARYALYIRVIQLG
jgi:hypothetical protein